MISEAVLTARVSVVQWSSRTWKVSGAMQKKKPPLADRVAGIAPFKVMELLGRAGVLAESGRDIIHMEVGEPDFATPRAVIEAGKRALDAGFTRYTPAAGLASLREQVADFYARELSITIPAERILITSGASAGLNLLAALLVNPGDSVLMTDPGYPCNRHFVSTFGGLPRPIPVGSASRCQLNGDLVLRNWQSETRGVLVASPSNPTGASLLREDLLDVLQVVKAKNGWLIADEIYAGISYTNEPVSAVSVADEIFSVNSFSKYFCMTGWRLGWLVVPPGYTEPLEKLAQNLYICPSSVSQQAALALFQPEVREELEARRETLRRRLDFLLPALQDLGFGVPVTPDGAFYIYAELPEQEASAEAFCHRLLESHGVAVTPGTDFGTHLADRHLRFTFCEDLPRLQQAVERISDCLTSGA